MSIGRPTVGSLDLATLQSRINELESKMKARLTGIEMATEDGERFNAHTFELVKDKKHPLSVFFIITGGQNAAGDPVVSTHLAQHPGLEIVWEGKAYVLNEEAYIAVIGKKLK